MGFDGGAGPCDFVIAEGEPHTMKSVIKYNVLTEARKVLRGEKTKVDEATLLHTLAGMFVAAQKGNKQKA